MKHKNFTENKTAGFSLFTLLLRVIQRMDCLLITVIHVCFSQSSKKAFQNGVTMNKTFLCSFICEKLFFYEIKRRIIDNTVEPYYLIYHDITLVEPKLNI